MTYDVRDKIVLVTGSAQGIGKATALLFASRGSRVVMVDRNAPLLASAAADVARANPGARVASYAYDLADLANVKAMIDRTISEQGGLDVLLNVAAITIGDAEYVVELDNAGAAFQKWKLMHDVNTTSLAYACQLAVGYWKAKGRKGAIVNVGSTAGIYPNTSMPIYSADKAFVIHFSRCMANLAPQIRVNAVCPGPTMTEGFALQMDMPEAGIGKQLRADTLDGNRSQPPSRLAEGIMVAVENENIFGQCLRVTPQRGIDIYNYRAGKAMAIDALTSSAKI
ncbi:hypothetical protein DFJ74DRAFT_713990 [Hyaloraphidium curvatum]|nr:hypothetical protein DFJ74DRAFT_713990 [Hyaloraphidium curvatum]